jgi:hypothetical protein
MVIFLRDSLFPKLLKKLRRIGTSLLKALAEIVIVRIEQCGHSWTDFWLSRPFQTEVPTNRIASEIEVGSNRMDGFSLPHTEFSLGQPCAASALFSPETLASMAVE